MLVPEPARPMQRAVIGWDIGIICYLTLAFVMAATATAASAAGPAIPVPV